jgi:lipocalin
MGNNESQITGNPSYKVQCLKDEDVKSYMGVWYEIAVNKSLLKKSGFEACCDGAVACYSDLELDEKKNMMKFNVNNYCIKIQPETGKTTWTCNVGSAQKIAKKIARFVVAFNEQMQSESFKQFLAGLGGDYLIIDINMKDPETSYSVVYGGQEQYFWILSRNPSFSKTPEFERLAKKYKTELSKCEIHKPEVYFEVKDFPFERACAQNGGKSKQEIPFS